jgi:glucokinase
VTSSVRVLTNAVAARRQARAKSRARYAVAPRAAAQTVFVGDIGGTNARLQVWTADPSDPASATMTFEKVYGTSGHPTFESVITDLFADAGVDAGSVSAACFAVAGPVANDRCQMTNISWIIDGAALQKSFDIASVKVINDFAAVGYGVLDLDPDEMVTLNEGTAKSDVGPIAVLGPGTGLGEAMLFRNATTGAYDVVPSEGSHADFAPRGDTQRALLAYCEEHLGECEIEQVCCGSGIARIYDFLRRHRSRPDLPTLDPAGVTDAALAGSCEVCVEAVEMFLEILGAEAGNLALKCLATGGVYVAGGEFLFFSSLHVWAIMLTTVLFFRDSAAAHEDHRRRRRRFETGVPEGGVQVQGRARGVPASRHPER